MKRGAGPHGHYGAWRLLGAAPAALLSAMLVTMVGGLLAPYTLLVVAGWLLCAPLLSLRPVERLAVRIAYHFRAPAGPDAEWLARLKSSTEYRSQSSAGVLEWYVRIDSAPNAFAAGHRSISVTTGFLHLLTTGRLTPDQAVTVALHEVGHHATRGAPYGLAAAWLSWPWQTVYVDAAISRASENAADTYAAGLGAGPDLADALDQLQPCLRSGLLGRARNSHPSTAHRQRRLDGTASPRMG